jgi:hypothetical protein
MCYSVQDQEPPAELKLDPHAHQNLSCQSHPVASQDCKHPLSKAKRPEKETYHKLGHVIFLFFQRGSWLLASKFNSYAKNKSIAGWYKLNDLIPV